MKGLTNAKSTIEKYETLLLTITGVMNPTVTVEGNSYTGSNLEIKVKAGTTYTVSFSEINKYIAPNNLSYTAVAYNVRTVNVEYIYDPVMDLSKFTIYGTPIKLTTANCYVIKEAGEYKFPCVYGNAISNGLTNSTSYTNNRGAYSHNFVNYKGNLIVDPWISTDTGETINSAQLSIADTDNIFTDITISRDYVKFTVASIPDTGANGIISIKNSSGTIMWNWHIWVWNSDLTPVSIINDSNINYNILPVNLASRWISSSSFIDAFTLLTNWYYQFGRPTPLTSASSYNSNTNATTYGTLSYTIDSVASNLQTGIQNPTTFYKYNSTNNYNWFSTNSGKTYNLWDQACTSTSYSDNNVVKTVYDPCPPGFKMPNGNTFTGFSNSDVVGSFTNGYYFKKNSSDTTGVFFSASGRRNYSNGSLYAVGSYGYIWSSASYSQNQAYDLQFHNGNITSLGNAYRAYGYSVRPVLDHIDLSHIFPMYLKSTEGSGDYRTFPANDLTRALLEYFKLNAVYDGTSTLDLDLSKFNVYLDEFKINGMRHIITDTFMTIHIENLSDWEYITMYNNNNCSISYSKDD